MSEIRDEKLAPSGRRKIDWVRDHMPVLNSIREDFRKTKPTEEQIKSAKELVKQIVNRYPTIKRVLNHKDLYPTLCPVVNLKEMITGNKEGWL